MKRTEEGLAEAVGLISELKAEYWSHAQVAEVIDAPMVAIVLRAGHDVTGLTHHSYRGVQCRAIRYTERLAEAKAVAGVGRSAGPARRSPKRPTSLEYAAKTCFG